MGKLTSRKPPGYTHSAKKKEYERHAKKKPRQSKSSSARLRYKEENRQERINGGFARTVLIIDTIDTGGRINKSGSC